MPLIIQVRKNDQEQMRRTLLTMIAAFYQLMSTPDSIQRTTEFGRGLALEGKSVISQY
jgi:hypothetical protein